MGVTAISQIQWIEESDATGEVTEVYAIAVMFAFFNRVAMSFCLEDPQYIAMSGEPDPLARTVV